MRQYHKLTSVSAATVLSVLLAWSCTTVKEDRNACPCYLTLDVDSYAVLDDCPTALVQVQGSGLIQNTITPRNYESKGYEVQVERRPNRVTLLGGLNNSVIIGDTLSLAKGKEADPLMVFNELVDCDGELAFVKAVPHKKWCNVHIIFIGEDSAYDYPYDIMLLADCNAMRITSGLPVWGEYRVPVNRSRSGDAVVRVPRQKENVMRLDFYKKDDDNGRFAGERVFYLDIGSDMEGQGYDWNKEDLDDVFIYVDYANMKANVNIVEWNVSEFKVEI